MQKLTKRVVDSIRPSGADKKIFDSQLPGFHVRVKPSGTKSYALKYRVAGRQRNVTIGRHGVITPDQARMEAFRLLATISEGDDPSAIRKAAFRDPTLAQLSEPGSPVPGRNGKGRFGENAARLGINSSDPRLAMLLSEFRIEQKGASIRLVTESPSAAGQLVQDNSGILRKSARDHGTEIAVVCRDKVVFSTGGR